MPDPVEFSMDDRFQAVRCLSGTVYGALINHRREFDALEPVAHQPPYKGLPHAPVLQARPRNTLVPSGAAVGVPTSAQEATTGPGVRVGASLGIVIGRTACRVAAAEALGVVAGYLAVIDLALPSDSHYRPGLRLRARDGFCVLADRLAPAASVPDPDALPVSVRIDGQVADQGDTGGRVRGVARLIADVTEFMTLEPGDVLLLGSAFDAPVAQAGQRVEVQVGQLPPVACSLVPETGADRPDTPWRGPALVAGAGRRARVAHGGRVHTAWPHPDGLRLADGRVLREDEVTWLAPFDVGTVIALGLNYAEHLKELSKELTVTAKDEPLAFLKGPGSIIGHRGFTRRPAGVKFMHYECELAVVIGRSARALPVEQALDHVAGYTVCNDYAVRDYLENWYRPNLRVKNRDGGTVLGPWFVPASEVPDPQALTLRTRVNGQVTQHGHTSDMVHSVAELIAWLSGFMTLQPGDVILTGTPDGVVNVDVGDEVVTEIDGIGRLVNTIAGDAVFGR